MENIIRRTFTWTQHTSSRLTYPNIGLAFSRVTDSVELVSTPLELPIGWNNSLGYLSITDRFHNNLRTNYKQDHV